MGCKTVPLVREGNNIEFRCTNRACRHAISPIRTALIAAAGFVFLRTAMLFCSSMILLAADYDLTGDGSVTAGDIAEFAGQWLGNGRGDNPAMPTADFDGSTTVDFADFARLAGHWRTVYEYVTTFLAGHEPAETHVEIRGPRAADPTLTIAASLPGDQPAHPVFGDVPPATQASHLLALKWTDETDRKIEYGYRFSEGMTFDLDNEHEIAFDVYVAPGDELYPDGDIAIWDGDFGWTFSENVPDQEGRWCTVVVDVSDKNHTNLTEIDAVVFQAMGEAGDNAGTIFVDNLRLRRLNPDYYALTATGHEKRIDLQWKPLSAPALQGYNIYRADSPAGPFTKLNDSPYEMTVYTDFLGENALTRHYRIAPVLPGGESAPSNVVSAASYAMTDDQLLTSVQRATFRYFYDFAHPVSGLAREGFKHPRDTVTTGGTGFGIMAIIVGAERGFVTRADAADHILKILTFLDEKASRYHGAWAHWLNGRTGQTIPFSTYDDGADLIETAFLVQGMLAARQYFTGGDDTETQIRTKVTQLWRDVEWDWFLRSPESEVLYWHWSPNYDWQMNMPIVGYHEGLIAYILAIASPTHPIPPACYDNGWARSSSYTNGNTYYGYTLEVGPAYGGPLFWTHYSFLGFDPRSKSDDYCNYFDNSRTISLINRAHCAANPNGFEGYSNLVWGLTASVNPWGYSAHSPTNDNGTISPTAALSAMPYVPAESLATLKHFYHTYGGDLFGPLGFRDAFNLEEDWFSDTYLAIDQGPIIVMIENHRTSLLWSSFMSNPEIIPALQAIGWLLPPGR
ncbi:MAG: hypothetical protein JW720_11850 [Sedimentisphaerales bacterium]|nr:hypothetical protein [Sedimentisphaerales bacterium]